MPNIFNTYIETVDNIYWIVDNIFKQAGADFFFLAQSNAFI